jgi:hypothetical protein
MAPIMVSTITENQSMALMAPRFMVGKPKAAMIASGGSSLSRSPFSGCRIEQMISSVSAPTKTAA